MKTDNQLLTEMLNALNRETAMLRAKGETEASNAMDAYVGTVTNESIVRFARIMAANASRVGK